MKVQHHPDNPFGEVFAGCVHGCDRDKRNHPLPFPRCIDVELTNTCNFTCKMCPTGQKSVLREKGFMSARIYREILDQICKHKTPIRFVRFGEPTLHPQLENYIKEAKKYGIIVHLNTNGFYLTDEMLAGFVNIPLDSIKFSFQGTDRKEYERWREKDFFVELISVLRTLRLLKKHYKKETPFVVVGTTITTESIKQVEIFKLKVGKYCDLFLCGYTHDLSVLHFPPKSCPEVFDKLSINWDGTVSACCGDYDNKMLVGDMKEETLLDIWFGAKLAYYREMIVGKKHSELELCRSCIRCCGLHSGTYQLQTPVS